MQPCSSITYCTWFYVALLRKPKGEGRGFAGGPAVAPRNLWAGAACATSSLLSPSSLLPWSQEPQVITSPCLPAPWFPSSKQSLSFSLGNPRGGESWLYFSPDLGPWAMHSLTSGPGMAGGPETRPPPQATWPVGPALGKPVLAQSTAEVCGF